MKHQDMAPFLFHSNISAAGALPARLKLSERAFTRIELFVVGAALLLIALVVAPAAVTTQSDSERLICFNNLRLIGRGVQVWAGDHNHGLPWRTPVSEGGEFTEMGVRPANTWAEYLFISNELVTPRILACPSDTGVRRAEDWPSFASSAFRSLALSYTVATDNSTDKPQDWVSGDRNIRPDQSGVSCSAGFAGVHGVIPPENSPSSSLAAWTNGAVHGVFGHVLTADGSVEFTSTPRLKELLSRSGDDASMHFLKAR